MQNTNIQIGSRFGLAALFVLLLGSIVFYQERMLLIDAPWVISHIINKKSFFIQEHRYGSFITQLFPLAGLYLGLSLKVLLLLYSVSFSFFYFAAAAILYRQKQYLLVLLLAFYHTLCVTDSYYWTNNEVHQGITWMCLMAGVWRSEIHSVQEKAGSFLLFTVLAFLAVFSHPIIIIASVFVFGFFILAEYGQLKRKNTIVYVSILLSIIAVKYFVSQYSWYDGVKISTIKSASVSLVFHVLHTNTAKEFLRACLMNYWQFSLLLLSGFVCMLLQKKYWPAIWTAAFLSAYFVCICIIYPESAFWFYIESEWLTFSLMGMLPFIYYVVPALKFRPLIIIFTLIFMIRLCFITHSRHKFYLRLQSIKNIVSTLQSRGVSKVIIPIENENDPMWEKLKMTWGLPVETLIWSTISGKGSVSAVCFLKEEVREKQKKGGKNKFINAFFTVPFHELNPKYFPFDTTIVYSVSDSSWNLK